MRKLTLILACALMGCSDSYSSDAQVQARRCRMLLALDSTRADSVRTLTAKLPRYYYDCAAWISLVPERAP